MDARSETASVPAPGEPHPVLQALLESIDERTPPDRRDALSAFAKAFLRRLSNDDLEASGVEQLYGLVRSAFDFADGRGPHPSAVRVFDPDPATDGYEAVGSVVETNTDDSPFLVDSVQEELLSRGLAVRRLLHPVIGTVRDEQGRIERVMSGRDASHRESVMHFELDRPLSLDERPDLEERTRRILHDVRLVVRDFEPMQERVRHMIELARAGAVRYSPDEVGEAVDFLEWLAQLNFVLLGYREYELVEAEACPGGRSGRCRPAASASSPTCSVRRSPTPPASPTSTPPCVRASRTATCSSSRRRTPTPRCIGARAWTTSASASWTTRARSWARRA